MILRKKFKDLNFMQLEDLKGMCLHENSPMDVTSKYNSIDDDDLCWVLYSEIDNSKLLGWGLLNNFKGQDPPILNIFVDKRYRRQGWGSKILEAVMEDVDISFDVIRHDDVSSKFYNHFGVGNEFYARLT